MVTDLHKAAQQALEYPSLYDKTGDIKDLNTLLVPLAALREALAKPDVPEWISVSEKMPPPDSNLLVVWGNHNAVDKAHTFTKWKHHSNPPGYLIQGHPGSHASVTHWMPLTAAPKPKDTP